MALRAARGLAAREGWPADLLPAVERAITRADPLGPDTLASQASRWGSIADELSELTSQRTSPEDRARIARLLSIAVSGTGIGSTIGALAAAPADFAQGVAADVRGLGATIADTAAAGASIAQWALPIGAAAALIWFLRRG